MILVVTTQGRGCCWHLVGRGGDAARHTVPRAAPSQGLSSHVSSARAEKPWGTMSCCLVRRHLKGERGEGKREAEGRRKERTKKS